MPRWHHSDSSSQMYQEVKSIKIFYAAHISRSQAKSMFGNWTKTPSVYITGSLFSRCMHLVGFTAHPYLHYPELPLPPLEERDGILNKKAIFSYKVGA